jgi:SAM-dependent methyltransferase
METATGLRDRETPEDGRLRHILGERLRERSAPQVGDEFYLHLLDLRRALAEALCDADGAWLDFGAGTAPYRDLLPDASLYTADLAGAEALRVDYELDEAGRCPCADGTFDGILSTQVLEHIPDPSAYLAEAFRIVRPGGQLVLSTHGIWEDHGGVDLWRWTADGLAAQIRAGGFEVDRVQKLTLGARAGLVLLRRVFATSPPPLRGVTGLILGALHALDTRFAVLDRYAERHLPADAESVPADRLYIAVVVEAHRPSTSQEE